MTEYLPNRVNFANYVLRYLCPFVARKVAGGIDKSVGLKDFAPVLQEKSTFQLFTAFNAVFAKRAS